LLVNSLNKSWRLVLRNFLLGGLFLFAGLPAHAQMPKEKPTGYVSDFAGVLSPAVREQLENLSTELDQKAHAQLAVVTVKSLEDRPIEDFAIDLATKWGIGTKAKKAGDATADRGVLLLLAVGNRRDRIEVGYGLEPIIPDGKAGGILRSMTPYLRNGDYDSALALGASSIASIIAQDANVALDANGPRVAPNSGGEDEGRQQISLFKIIVILIVLLPFLFFSRRGGFWTGGGGFSGGGGGFGGFGGGSFGGGGSSGSW
jgi:uncharacterized protein